MNKKQAKRQRDIKTKLMAAICMLLVSSIMMVSTTYAWFTLSTAPEVTGIQTAVGANGNLEMALMPTNGDVNLIESKVGDSTAATNDATVSNITWGNLVDLSNSDFYGLDEITLYPAELNVATWDNATTKANPATLADIFLKTPTYGSDGRVAQLLGNTTTSTYKEGNFPQNSEYGVRAVGVASGMTDRQLAYRNAKSAANTAMAQAKDAATASLNTNGNALANIAITHGTNRAATHTQADVTALLAIVEDLLGTYTVSDGTVTYSAETDGALEYIEEAYIQNILAYGASKAASDAGMDDLAFNAFKTAVESAGSLDAVVTTLEGEPYNITLDATVHGFFDKLSATRTKVEEAMDLLIALRNGNSNEIAWGSISPALYLLADTDAMTINGVRADEVTSDAGVNQIIQTIGSGLTVTMSTGGGVYADIADHCGNYSASIVIKELTYGGTTVRDLNARMATATTANPVYLSAMGAVITGAGAPESANGTAMPITDMYGYIIDLAFRTNAAESNLLLQQEGIDRIYDENGNEDTMGKGSSMTFKATTADFSDNQVKDLMSAIRVVFFNRGEAGNDVIATAKLNVAGATQSAEGWTAKLYIYTVTAGGQTAYRQTAYDSAATDVTYYVLVDVYAEKADATEADLDSLYTRSGEEGNYVYTKATEFAAGTPYFTKSSEYQQLTGEPAEGQVTYTQYTTTNGENPVADNKIMSLTQNTPTPLSVLVYLDGNKVTNGSVAATAATSVTGTMNLQFSSSATLVPMEYADLHLPETGVTEEEPETPETPENQGGQ